MVKTQVQIPDELYRKAKQIAKEREWSLAEVMRRGLEYMTTTCLTPPAPTLSLPSLETGAFVDQFDELDLRSISHEEETMRGVKP